MDLTAVDHLLTTTRAVRRRLDVNRPVERSVLLDCIRVAQQAPTGGNMQNWRFLIVTDPDKRARLAEIYNSIGSWFLPQQRDAATDDQTRRVYESGIHLTEILAEVPVHVIPCMLGRIPAGAPTFAYAASYAGIIPAAWSFMLAARSRGLGTCWTSLHLQKEQEAAEILGIPPDVTQVALIPVAYYKGEDFHQAKRSGPETIVSWNTWHD